MRRHPFPSSRWAQAFGAAINASDAYRDASTAWTHGAVALVVIPDEELEVDATGIWLDLERGSGRRSPGSCSGGCS